MFSRDGFTKEIRKAEDNSFRKLRRAKEAEWKAGRSHKWVLLAENNPKAFWRAFRSKKPDLCPVSQAEQLEYYKNLVGIEPRQDVLLQENHTEDATEAAEQAELTGLLDADFDLEELQKVLKN